MAESKLKAALAAYDAVMDDIGTCGDGGCIVKRPVGQHTNGGCRCYSDRMRAQRVMLAAGRLRAGLNEEVAGDSVATVKSNATLESRDAAAKSSEEKSGWS